MNRVASIPIVLVLLATPVVTAPVQEPLQATVTIGTRVGAPLSGYQGGGRDPFESLVVVAATPKAAPTPARRIPGLAGMAHADVVLKGIVASGTVRLALLAGTDGKTYLAKLQDRLQDAVVRRIESDAVVLLTTAGAPGGSREVRKTIRPASETQQGGGGQ
jgi:hypothetical protein